MRGALALDRAIELYVKPLDTSAAEAYEKFILPFFMRPITKEVIERAAPRPGERVLDVACGTGLATGK